GAAGGAIYSDGGSVKLLNCAFKENTSGYGGAICIKGGAVLDMLNCTLFSNTSNSGALYNGGGEANIIYSTFNGNTAKSSGGGAITSLGKTKLVGSIASLNGYTDLDGNVSVYGSYITNSSDNVSADTSTVTDSGNRIFSCTPNNGSYWYFYNTSDKASYKTALSPIIKEGIYVKSIDGKVAYSTDDTEWTVTDITSVFTDEDYKSDIYGNSHDRLFGSISEVCEDAQFICIEDNKAYIYVPAAQDAVFIEKIETYDNVMTDVNVYEVNFGIGTNSVKLKKTDTENSIRTYMLWDGLDTMKPIIANIF
ncbi:MAG: hypothetical protein SOZ28_07780, partial [Clostridia bacterium]|nr:hypothetical protein [Clostridia bacterium]